MRKTILLLLVILILCSGCHRVEPFTTLIPLRDFIVLDNGDVEAVWMQNGRFRTIIISPENVYVYDGESEIIETLQDGYFKRFIYLSEEDYERFMNESIK